MDLLPTSVFAAHLPSLLDLLRQLVEFESPTTEKASVDRLGEFIAGEMARLGAEVTRYPQQEAGDHWCGIWGTGPGGVLLLTHFDTVHPLGSLRQSSWRHLNERAYGPGVLDMKASIAIALTVILALRQAQRLPGGRLALLCTSDEETGSHTSRPLIENLAREYPLALCLEPSLPGGALKTSRKGVGMFELTVRGRAAHAGANPESGVNAILEMAHQLQHLSTLGDDTLGTTVNVGVIRGGTRSNVVPEMCTSRIDVRVASSGERARVDEALSRLSPLLQGANLELQGEWNRPPMERSPLMLETFRRAREIATALGIDLEEGSTGGASDANFVAALGIPVLDGLGAVGDGAHTATEYVEVGSLPERAALLAALMVGWGESGPAPP